VGEALNGRAMWLWGIRRALTVPIAHLLRQRWTILRPPEGRAFLTSDNPVIRLRFRAHDDYDLNGGWGVPKTDIFLPLGPGHLLYTQIDRRVPSRGSRMVQELYELIYRTTIENAYRQVIASHGDPEVEKVRPRSVDAAQVQAEREMWATWHQKQTAAELEIRSPLPGSIGGHTPRAT